MGYFRPAPYAKAFHQVVLDRAPGREEAAADELARLARAIEISPELRRALVTPTISVEDKAAIVESILDLLAIEEPTRSLAHVLQRNYRILHTAVILAAYRELVDRSHGRVRARIEVAGRADRTQRARIVDTLAGVVRAEIVAEFEANDALLAGFRATLGSRVFDGSLVGQLEQIVRHIGS